MLRSTGTGPLDALRRPLHDLRISVTDRCNMRCRYCMPREVFGPDHAFLERDELLSFEEITRVVRAAARLGVGKIRLTGGEPLLRRDLPVLVEQLHGVEGIAEIALTSNGVLLPRFAPALRDAGLTRVTVSLDALDQETFAAVTDSRATVAQVLAGMDAAERAGFPPVKINAVVRHGVNEHAIVDLARFGRETGRTVRFIEFMDVGSTNGWQRDEVVTADDVLAAVGEHWDVEPVDGPVGVAERYRYLDGAGELGVIASVTRAFCRTCVRARLSAVGELFTCLFATSGHDLLTVVRGDEEQGRPGADVDQLTEVLRGIWEVRADRYSLERSRLRRAGPTQRHPDDGDRVEMSYIGG